MGRYVAGESPAMDRLVEETIKGVGAEIGAMRIPRLRGVVLGGGYGRGEGGVFEAPGGIQRLYNDLDFFAVTEDGASGRDIDVIAAALAPISRRWTGKLGIDVDFVVRTPWRMRHDQERVMIQELLHGYFDVAGEPGVEMFRGMERRDPGAFPWSEAARQLMNRGMGLAFASVSDDADFAARNINKCILGVGDALLIARGGYRWRAADRAAALGDTLYSAAVEWKFRPRAGAVADWDAARAAWLDATEKVLEAGRRTGALRRTVRQGARWIARRRTLGSLRTLGFPPAARILVPLAEAIRGRRAVSASLTADWKVFN